MDVGLLKHNRRFVTVPSALFAVFTRSLSVCVADYHVCSLASFISSETLDRLWGLASVWFDSKQGGLF